MTSPAPLTATTTTERRDVRAVVEDGPTIGHPANSHHLLTLTAVDVLMRRSVPTPVIPRANTEPVLEAVTVFGLDATGQPMSGTWPAHLVTLPAHDPAAPPAFISAFALACLADWSGELAARGVRNQVASVSGGGLAIQAHTISGGVTFPRPGFPFA